MWKVQFGYGNMWVGILISVSNVINSYTQKKTSAGNKYVGNWNMRFLRFLVKTSSFSPIIVIRSVRCLSETNMPPFIGLHHIYWCFKNLRGKDSYQKVHDEVRFFRIKSCNFEIMICNIDIWCDRERSKFERAATNAQRKNTLSRCPRQNGQINNKCLSILNFHCNWKWYQFS